MVDGWFFDSGVDLKRTIAAGWHHVAVATSKGTTAFYADGEKIGSRKTSQPAIRLKGAADYVEVPAHANPTTAITVSIWARSATVELERLWLPGEQAGRVRHAPRRRQPADPVLCLCRRPGLEGCQPRRPISRGGTCTRARSTAVTSASTSTGTSPRAPGRGIHPGGFGLRCTSATTHGNNAYFKGDIAEVSIWRSARSRSTSGRTSIGPSTATRRSSSATGAWTDVEEEVWSRSRTSRPTSAMAS